MIHAFASERKEAVQSGNKAKFPDLIYNHLANYGIENYTNDKTYIFYEGIEFSFEYSLRKMEFKVKSDFSYNPNNRTAYYSPPKEFHYQ